MLTFHELYTSYSSQVYRFACWLARDTGDAEDITAETFIRAWINIAFVRTETLQAYLFKIARNIYLEQLRKKKRVVDLYETHPDPHPDQEKTSETNAALEMAQAVLQSLPEIDRAAFILRVQHELPYAEIARVLELTETAVKVKVHRVRKKMLETRMSKEVI